MPADRLLGWVVALVITAVAGVLRLRDLGHPHAFVFDETYYAKDAWSLLRFGAEQEWVKDADKAILAGDIEKLSDNPSYVVHPPAGKWVIALGEQLRGFEPMGWRLPLAVLGTLSVLLMVRLAGGCSAPRCWGHRGAAAGHGRAPLRREQDGTARPDPDVLGVRGVRLPRARPRQHAQPAGRGAGARRAHRPVRSAAGRPAVAAAGRSEPRARMRHQVERTVVRGLVRAAVLLLGLLRAPGRPACTSGRH
jgi:hypothetical protein